MTSYIGLWEIAVLSLLREAPMHPYEMQRLLHLRRKDELLGLKRGSLYHAINRLLKAGLIEMAGTGRDGRRPLRTTYRVTGEGRRELVRSLRQLIAVPQRQNSEFMTALSFVIFLTPGEAVARLEEREEALRRETAEIEAQIDTVRGRVARIHLIESEYYIAMQKAEMTWVRRIAGQIRSGDLTWDLKELFKTTRGDRGRPHLAKKQI